MKVLVFLGFLLLPTLALANIDTAIISNKKVHLMEGKQISIFKDRTGKMRFEEIRDKGIFMSPTRPIPNVGVSSSVFWIKFTIFNETNENVLLINIKNPHLNSVKLYYPTSNDTYATLNSGNLLPISAHLYKNQNSLFKVPIPPYTTKTLYLRINSIGQIIIPIYVGTDHQVLSKANRDDLSFGVYLGIILIMFFYNLFIYFTVRDKDYLYYINFIVFVGFAQICLQGFGYRILWSTNSFITLQSVNWSGALSGIASVVFARVFLHIKERAPILDKVLVGLILLDGVSILFTVFGAYNFSYLLIDIIALIGSSALWGIGAKLAFEGFRPAKFFLIAWSFFLLSVIIFVIKDFGQIPYNFFTNNILLIGSSIEIALLSFALADKINNYKKEKEISQARALQASLEKEQFVKEQNVILESKIQERTKRLQQINKELNTTLTHLKDTQSQLVDAEKMASLGQLTAGIAHEINNPINFVKSNIKPLQLDIEDLKALINKYEGITEYNIKDKLQEITDFRQEIELDYLIDEISSLLNGIEDGATRTADIVKGLRVFSRVDESELKEADIHEGIDTTLMLLNNTKPKNVSVTRQYDDLPLIECYPGKLNQVFMNLLNNSIQAVKYKGEPNGNITITTLLDGDQVIIKIKDSGVGIPPSVKEKIFDPFFTTKDIGEGTGLGLSIVYSIIEKHQGTITATSEEGHGAEFIITLPVRQTKKHTVDPKELESEDKS